MECLHPRDDWQHCEGDRDDDDEDLSDKDDADHGEVDTRPSKNPNSEAQGQGQGWTRPAADRSGEVRFEACFEAVRRRCRQAARQGGGEDRDQEGSVPGPGCLPEGDIRVLFVIRDRAMGVP